MLEHVRFEISGLSEGGVAVRALVRLFASVLEHVRLEMPGGSGLVIALRTSKWLFASVSADMNG